MLAVLAQLDPPGRGDQPNRPRRHGEGLEHRPVPGRDLRLQARGHPGHFVDEVIARNAVVEGGGPVDLVQGGLDHRPAVSGRDPPTSAIRAVACSALWHTSAAEGPGSKPL